MVRAGAVPWACCGWVSAAGRRAIPVVSWVTVRSVPLPVLPAGFGAVGPAVGVGPVPLIFVPRGGCCGSLALSGVHPFHLGVWVNEVMVPPLVRRDEETDGGGIRGVRWGRLRRGAPFVCQIVYLFPLLLRQGSW